MHCGGTRLSQWPLRRRWTPTSNIEYRSSFTSSYKGPVLILRVHVGKLSSEFILGEDITYTTRPDSPFITIKFISTRISHPELPNGAAAEGAVATLRDVGTRAARPIYEKREWNARQVARAVD